MIKVRQGLQDICKKLTGHTGKQLPGKALNLAVWKRHKRVSLQEIKDTLTQQIHDNADMPSVVKAIPEVYTSISVLLIVCFESRQNPQLYS